ncbi:PilZ domain-containing protein [Acidobacteria bacterium AH-259-G07]|nr:PilZ domain-containing protein [Acidobacteria bacterium AH-259-G07]
MKDRRKFKRWEVSIPCTAQWKEWKITGKITNICLGGALITQVNAVPPEGALIIVAFEAKQEDVVLHARITSEVIHTIWEVIEDGHAGSFGVKFEEPVEKVRQKLIPVFRTLISAEADKRPARYGPPSCANAIESGDKPLKEREAAQEERQARGVEMKAEDNPFHLLSVQLHLIAERLILLNGVPFVQAQYLLQEEALIRDIQSAGIYLSQFRQWKIFKELILVHRTALENLSQEIDYDLAVLHLRISGLAKHVPSDKAIYQRQLRKLSEEGEKLEELNKQLIQLFSKYCF